MKVISKTASVRKEREERPYQINVIDKAMTVLDALTSSSVPLTLGEISEVTGINVSTAMRLVVNLRHHGLVARNEDSGKYRLGYRLLTLGDAVRSSSGIVEYALPIMRELSNVYSETTVLSIRSGDYRIDLEQVIGNQTIRRVLTLGRQKPLYAGAASRVLLSGMSDREIDAYLNRVELRKTASGTITDPTVLKRTIREIRRDGYACSVKEQSDNSAAGVVAPVRNNDGKMIAALGFSIPSFRFTDELRGTLVPAVMAAAQKMSSQIK